MDGHHRVAIISDGFWRRRFNADPQVVGKTLTFEMGTWEIVGVMPAGFQHPIGATRPTDMWVPFVVPADQRVRGTGRSYYLNVLGRLKAGVTLAAAQAEMDRITAGLAAQTPDWFKDRVVSVRPWRDALLGTQTRSWMLMLLGAVGFVLLIACVNVANLMLARATVRSRDIGIRAAMGASRWQLMRGLLVESLVLSIAGTVLGVVVAYWGVSVLRATLPATLPRLANVAVDLRVLGAAAIAAIATGLFFGIVPAIQSSRPNLTTALREGGRSGAAGNLRQRLRSALVIAEVALALVLLVGAGLFVVSFARLMAIDIGINYRNVLTVPMYPRIDFNNAATRDAQMARAATMVSDALERVRAVPGVERAAAFSGGLPLSNNRTRTGVSVPWRKDEFIGDDSASVRRITPEYFDIVGVALKQGRLFTAVDDAKNAAPVVVLNDIAVTRYFEGRDPLNTVIDIYGNRTVVGVVSSVRMGGPESELGPEAYIPIGPSPSGGADLVMRTRVDPSSLVPAVKAAIWTVAPELPITDAPTFETLFNRLIAQRKFTMLLIGLFGILSIVIAAVGIYGVMAYVVEQRTAEIGVRMALGAERSRILRMVLGRAAVFMAIGLAAGLLLSWLLASTIGGFLFRVEPHDPLVYAAVSGTLAVVGLVAAFVPALRASRVDPLIALRT